MEEVLEALFVRKSLQAAEVIMRGYVIALLICVSILTGCGNTTQPDSGVSKSSSASIQEDTPYFQLTEYEIPDADEALTMEGILQNENRWTREVGLTVQESTLFRCVNLEESMADGRSGPAWFSGDLFQGWNSSSGRYGETVSGEAGRSKDNLEGHRGTGNSVFSSLMPS